MSEVRFEKGTDDVAINQVANFIRELERKDFEAHFDSVREGLTLASLNADSLVTGYLDGEPVAIFGVGLNEGLAVPWLALTEEATEEKYRVVKYARAWVGVLRGKYPLLQNFVLAEDQPAIDLLEVCGFSVDQSKTIEKNGLGYYYFWIGERG